jgi:hypothetical protein
VADQATLERTGAADGEAPLTNQYEQLREVALTGHAEGWRHGLGVLATRGMTGWMTACRAVAPPPTPAAPPAVRRTVDTFGPDAGELVAVMAAMALAHTAPTPMGGRLQCRPSKPPPR